MKNKIATCCKRLTTVLGNPESFLKPHSDSMSVFVTENWRETQSKLFFQFCPFCGNRLVPESYGDVPKDVLEIIDDHIRNISNREQLFKKLGEPTQITERQDPHFVQFTYSNLIANFELTIHEKQDGHLDFSLSPVVSEG